MNLFLLKTIKIINATILEVKFTSKLSSATAYEPNQRFTCIFGGANQPEGLKCLNYCFSKIYLFNGHNLISGEVVLIALCKPCSNNIHLQSIYIQTELCTR